EPEVEAQLPYQFFDRHSQSDIEFDSQVQSPSQLVPPPGPEIAAQPKTCSKSPTVEGKFFIDPMKFREAQKKKHQQWDGVCGFADGYI
ncbi:unnamed protein product, partial [Durusdinium trenchii]